MRLTIAMKVWGRLLLGAVCCAGVLMASGLGESVHAQAFSSGSDGSDGPLDLAPNLGTVIFDPNDTTRWGRLLDQDGDGVYHFTTITIRGGTTLKATAEQVVRPLYWLASGDITIEGSIDIRGAAGQHSASALVRRQLPIPGPGGFAGGAGALIGGTVPPTAGDGPGGGAAATIACGSGAERCGSGGSFTGNRYLVPLQGGSGGGGGLRIVYANGSAGGGAILLASSTMLVVNGAILASGGSGTTNGSWGGGGSGGAIRLVAPALSGTGTLDVSGGGAVVGAGIGRPGMVRLERFTQTGSFSVPAGGQFVTLGSPVDAGTLRPQGLVRVTTIGGVALPATASGSFVIPDVTISSAAPVPVVIEASGVPSGTVVTLVVFPQTPDDDAVITLPPVQATLEGTVERSTATINFTFPYGFSRGTLRATW